VTAEAFQTELEQRIVFGWILQSPSNRRTMCIAITSAFTRKNKRDTFIGRRCFARTNLGRPDVCAAALAERFAGGELRTTNMQNLLVVNVPKHNVGALAKELDDIGLRVDGSPFWRARLRVVDPNSANWRSRNEEFFPLAGRRVRRATAWFRAAPELHVTGCPNSCGQHWIADIGIEGKKIKVGDRMLDAYYFCLGGALGLHSGSGSSHWLPLPG